MVACWILTTLREQEAQGTVEMFKKACVSKALCYLRFPASLCVDFFSGKWVGMVLHMDLGAQVKWFVQALEKARALVSHES